MRKKSRREERANLSLRRLDKMAGIPLVLALSLLRRRRPLALARPKSIVVLCFGAIGDTLLATVLLNALSLHYPEARIHICASAANAGALPLLGPRHASAAFPIGNVAAIIRHLRNLKADILIDTTQWARVGALFSLLSGAKRTIGFDTPGQYRGFAYDHPVPHRNDRHETENFLALARVLAPSSAAEPSLHVPDTPPRHIDLNDFPQLDKIVYLHMFASGVSARLKEWPESHWRDLALACREAGFAVCFTGSPQDGPRVKKFLQEQVPAEFLHNGDVRSLAGLLSLPELAWLLRRGAGAVSVNTGILHLMALCGLPTVDLHGPTNPLRWGGVGPNTVSLLAPGKDTGYLNLGFEIPEDATPSLHRLTVEDVLYALRGLGLTAFSL
ncbi:MAG: glycosyltransferase family 9 protein [Desulfovibrio sp.]|jgi:ADP-heptose:LPS heptosyltransferase|nr:glycosyltransferase family 9 protein [Desulfovibrio sp.]